MKKGSRRVSAQSKHSTYFENFTTHAIIMELKKIIKIGRNPIDRKKLKKDDIQEIRQMIKELQ